MLRETLTSLGPYRSAGFWLQRLVLGARPTRPIAARYSTFSVLMALFATATVVAIAPASRAWADPPSGFEEFRLVAADGTGNSDTAPVTRASAGEPSINSALIAPAAASATTAQRSSVRQVADAGNASDPAIEQPEQSAQRPPSAAQADTDDTQRSDTERSHGSPAAASPASSPEVEQPLTGEMRVLRDRIRRTLSAYYNQWVLNSRDHTPWEVMHAIVAYGVRTQLHQGGPRGKKVSAIGWLCFNGPCKRIPLLSLERGELRVKKGPYVQGHHGQFLAMLAQARLVPTYPIRVGGKHFTVADLIEVEKRTCEPGTELTFKLLSLSHYLSTEDTWTDQRGRSWSISRLIAEEIRQPILRTAACGGTHRLMGLSYAVAKRRKEQLPIDGQFARADKYTRDFRRYAFQLQNRDGSFSTKWFERREAQRDRDRRLKTTGHVLEWIVYSSPQEELDSPRVVRAVNYLNNLLWQGRDHQWEIGPLGHALHALRLYHRRRFEKSHAEQARAELARREKARRAALAAQQQAAPSTVAPADAETPDAPTDDDSSTDEDSAPSLNAAGPDSDSIMSQTDAGSSATRDAQTEGASRTGADTSAAESADDDTAPRASSPSQRGTSHNRQSAENDRGNQVLLILP